MTEREPYSGGTGVGAGTSMGTSDNDTSSTMDQARDKAGEAMDQAKQQAASRLSGQKERAAGGLDSVAEAVRQTSRQMREQDQGAIAEYADRAAGQIERFSRHLREADMDQLMGEVEDFARRQPAVFVGGALLLGFIGARFLKTSAPSSREGETGYSPPARWRGPYGYGTGPGGMGAGSRYEYTEDYGTRTGGGYYGRSPSRPYTGSTSSSQSEGEHGTGEAPESARQWRSGETGPRPFTRPSEGVEDE